MNRTEERSECDTTDRITESGAIIPAYDRIRPIGSGGGGTVYLVKHKATGQLRAAKIFHRNRHESQQHELQMLRQLKHGAFPGIIDILEDAAESWLIMEYIEGKNLQDVRKHELNAEQFFFIVEQLLAAVEYLHVQNPPILHLDIKPSNLLLDCTGRLCVIDFGASCHMIQGTPQNPCIGTPGFSAPEQMDPLQSVDERADIYGCGAVMYWLLCGRVPSEAEQEFWQKSGRKGAGVKRWEKEIYDITRRCLQKDRKDRFADIMALKRSVARIRNRQIRREKRKKAMGAMLLLVLVLVFSFSALNSERQGHYMTMHQKYQQQLQMSENFGIEQAAGCYEAAALLCPEDFSWCLHLVERISQDYSFEIAEEKVVKSLLYMAPPDGTATYIELLEESPHIFSDFCYQLGLAYWYFYEGSGGKGVAANWFAGALVNGKQEVWYESAEIHAKIGTYYDRLNRKNMQGELEVEYGIYWKDMYELWTLEPFRSEISVIRRQSAEELLSGILFRVHDLEQYGVAYKTVETVLEEIELFAEETGEETMQVQCQEAEKAARRAFGIRRDSINKESEELGGEQEQDTEK